MPAKMDQQELLITATFLLILITFTCIALQYKLIGKKGEESIRERRKLEVPELDFNLLQVTW